MPGRAIMGLVLFSVTVSGAEVGGELQPDDPGRIGPYRVIRRLGSGGMGQVSFAGQLAGGRSRSR